MRVEVYASNSHMCIATAQPDDTPSGQPAATIMGDPDATPHQQPLAHVAAILAAGLLRLHARSALSAACGGSGDPPAESRPESSADELEVPDD